MYFGTINSEISSLFNFDIPPSYSGMTCDLTFTFPTQSQLQTSSFTFSGSGDIDFALLSKAVTLQTTFNTVPEVKKDYGTTTVAPGNAYKIASFACPAGEAIGFEMKSENGTELSYFQDYNPCPIGLYIVPSPGKYRKRFF
jgi:hypothetical protein